VAKNVGTAAMGAVKPFGGCCYFSKNGAFILKKNPVTTMDLKEQINFQKTKNKSPNAKNSATYPIDKFT
jgi:hypothetical protein